MVGMNRQLGAVARLPRSCLYFNDPVVDLRNLQLKKSFQKAGMAPRQDYLGPLAALFYLHDKGLDSFIHPVTFTGQLLLLGQNSFYFSQVYDDIAMLKTADRSGSNILNPFQKLLVDQLPLCFPDSLNNHLLGCLGGNPAKFLLGDLLLDQIA